MNMGIDKWKRYLYPFGDIKGTQSVAKQGNYNFLSLPSQRHLHQARSNYNRSITQQDSVYSVQDLNAYPS